MAKFPWKSAVAVVALLGATAYAVAQMGPGMGSMGPMGGHGPMHDRMMRGQGEPGGRSDGRSGGMHPGMRGGMYGPSSAAEAPSMPGQDAFGTIQEIVQILEADPATDWSKVNIGALREHLIDMHEVTLRARAAERMLDNGIEVTVTGDGRTRDAIKRMVPAHMRELSSNGWRATAEELTEGVKVTVTADDAAQRVKLKALGFMGLMVQGGHHQPHHLMMAKGQFPMH